MHSIKCSVHVFLAFVFLSSSFGDKRTHKTSEEKMMKKKINYDRSVYVP